jgi:hypothetical protein
MGGRGIKPIHGRAHDRDFAGAGSQQGRPAERKTMIDREYDLPIIRLAETLILSISSIEQNMVRATRSQRLQVL